LPQSFDQGRIRYSGSPIPLSFSESRYEHQILEVAVEAGGVRAVTPHLVPRCVPLLRLPETAAAPLSDLLPLLAGLPAAADVPATAWPYVEINLLDDGPDPTRRRQIESALEKKAARLAAIRLHAPARSVEMPEDGSTAAASATPRDAAALQSLDPVALTSEHYRQRHGQDIPADLIACLREIVLVADNDGEPSSPTPSQVAAHSAISVHVPSAPDA
nr:exonuclease SbcCD subunit D C-terminal domain-containing protein [Opitutaceae bacterium]